MSEPTGAFTGYVPAPADSAEWGAWLKGTAAEAKRAFDGATDDTPVWDPSGADAGVPFWSRRLFGEMCVHRADAAATLDQPYELAPELAVAAAMRGDGQTLHFHATDAPGEWVARREQDRVALERTHAKADVAVRGPAVNLMLVLSRRRKLEAAPALEILGERALFTHWIDHMDWVTGADPPRRNGEDLLVLQNANTHVQQ